MIDIHKKIKLYEYKLSKHCKTYINNNIAAYSSNYICF